MTRAIGLLVAAGVLTIAAVLIRARPHEWERQSWTGGRTTRDWPSDVVWFFGVAVCSGGVAALIGATGSLLAVLGAVVLVPSLLMRARLDRARRKPD